VHSPTSRAFPPVTNFHETRFLTMQPNPAGIAPPIVVVDDDRDAREMLSEYLAFCGFAVHQAQDGREAIDVAERVRPAVMLLDLMMPRMDGWEATRRLKTGAGTREITIVAVSACTHPGDQERARRVGCDEFVCKPVDLESLAQLVNRLLARNQLGDAEIA
jgi:CheY-like chemotaxis protein